MKDNDTIHEWLLWADRVAASLDPVQRIDEILMQREKISAFSVARF